MERKEKRAEYRLNKLKEKEVDLSKWGYRDVGLNEGEIYEIQENIDFLENLIKYHQIEEAIDE